MNFGSFIVLIMEKTTEEIRNNLIEAVLPQVIFDGWTLTALKEAAEDLEMDHTIVPSVFPDGISDAINHFAHLYDQKMLQALSEIDIEEMRVRDRIREAVLKRLELLEPHKEAVRSALSFWSLPTRSAYGAKSVWRTADCIWIWAGDESKDYNKYTKRILLSGVISSTTLAWMDDESENIGITSDFLDRRIDNVMKMGQFIGRFKRAS